MRQLGSFSDDPQKDHCDIRRRRHLFRCWHRGTQGDHIRGLFAETSLNTLGSKQLDQLEALLDCTDADLFDWAIGGPTGRPCWRTQPAGTLLRVKVPSGVKMMPHRHPEDRIALGGKFDGDKVKAYPPGCVVILPRETPHFHWAKFGEYVTQVTAIGPLGLEDMNSKDDPRNRSSQEKPGIPAAANG
jgi:succinate dehydrogenase flavin-adding protein (antitoxin of CptAB toxin-antitoxin module)